MHCAIFVSSEHAFVISFYGARSATIQLKNVVIYMILLASTENY